MGWSIGISIWIGVAVIIGAVWVVRFIATVQLRGKRQILTSYSYDGPPEPATRVSILVAAKDEQNDIEECITGLLHQDYPDFELIVIDDRSADQTPVILKRLAQDGHSRLRVITIKSLPDGWCGKNHAMHEGMTAATGEWFLFTDADCKFDSERTLSMAMREAFAHEADFLSVTPVLDAPTVWERVVQPVCALALMIWFLPHRVNKPGRKTAYANGAFMLIRRTCYDLIGGHERVKSQLNEDIKLARLAKDAGVSLRVVENDGLYRTRMYGSLSDAWRGWSRILSGSLGTGWRVAAAIGLMATLSIFPWISLCVAAWGYFVFETGTAISFQYALGAWLAVVVVQLFVIWDVYRTLRVPSAWFVTYLLGALFTLGVLVDALFKVLGAQKTVWRGTSYRAGRCTDESDVPVIRHRQGNLKTASVRAESKEESTTHV